MKLFTIFPNDHKKGDIIGNLQIKHQGYSYPLNISNGYSGEGNPEQARKDGSQYFLRQVLHSYEYVSLQSA